MAAEQSFIRKYRIPKTWFIQVPYTWESPYNTLLVLINSFTIPQVLSPVSLGIIVQLVPPSFTTQMSRATTKMLRVNGNITLLLPMIMELSLSKFMVKLSVITCVSATIYAIIRWISLLYTRQSKFSLLMVF